MTSSPTPAVLPDARARALRVLADVTEQMAPAGKYVARDILSGNLSPENERAIAAMFAYAKEAPPASDAAVPAGEVYRHVKRGTTYEVLGTAELQASQLQAEHAELVIYRGDDGKLWARNSGEFHDGRFERLSAAAPKVASDADEHEKGRDFVFDVLEALKLHLPKIAFCFARGTGGIEREDILAILTAPKVASDTGAGLLRTISRAIHEHLSRRDIMQYLDNDEDCEGLARAVLAALATDATDGGNNGRS